MSTENKQGYDLLIQFIRDELKKREERRKELKKIQDEENRPIYGLKFTSFDSQAERDEFVNRLVEEIKKVDNYLELVAGRNNERHKELVSLLVEQFDIEIELETKDPKGAGGFFHQQCAKVRLDEIHERIKEIVNAQNVC